MDENIAELTRVLHLAAAEVNRQNPGGAHGLLRSIRTGIDGVEGSAEWAEFQLLVAEATAATGEPGASVEFEEALSRIAALSVPRPDLEIRGREHFGDFLVRSMRRRSAAHEHYRQAAELAASAHLWEDRARLMLKLIKLDLEADGDRQLGSFQNFKRAAMELRSTACEQLQAWLSYLDERRRASAGLQAARGAGAASVDYFRGLLARVRRESR